MELSTEGERRHVPGAIDGEWGLVTRVCSNLCDNLASDDVQCAQVAALVGRLQTQDMVGELLACVEAYAAELEQCALERHELRRMHSCLLGNVTELETRCATLESALDRAADLDRERAEMLRKSEAARELLQAQIRNAKSGADELRAAHQQGVTQAALLHDQIRSLTQTIEKLTSDRNTAQGRLRQEAALHQITEKYSQADRENGHLKQAATLAKHGQATLANELSQARRQLQQSDKMLLTTQRSLEKVTVGKRKKDKDMAELEKKVADQDAQISKLCASLRQLRVFFHSIETMDAANLASSSAPRKPFQFGRIVKELDKLSTTVEGL